MPHPFRNLFILCISAALTFGADPALTIYNKNFAVVRETLPLDLNPGTNTVQYPEVTSLVEPESVILRDPAGKQLIRVLEQNYRNDVLSQALLLNIFEGKTIDFATRFSDGTTHVVKGKIVRSGYLTHYRPAERSNPQHWQDAMIPVSDQPVIEVDGRLEFTLPGEPIFPTPGQDMVLKPTLNWILYSGQAARFNAELSYISGGLSWSSDYNLVAPEVGDMLDLVGWATLDNRSGKQFDHARIKLMAGDINKLRPGQFNTIFNARAPTVEFASGQGEITQKDFEDYHLYSLPQATTLHDLETKQVEFLRASAVQSKRLYIYDGAKFVAEWRGQDLRQLQQYGTESNPNVWIMREFLNSSANHLGIPLPAGRVRFYRRDQDGQLEFTGENEITHTPKDETVHIYTGNAFDITGERRQTQFKSQFGPPGFVDESFEIKLRNHKKETAAVKVVEHLYRWSNWTITQESVPHKQVDSKTIEFEVSLQPDEEKVLTYLAHYTW